MAPTDSSSNAEIQQTFSYSVSAPNGTSTLTMVEFQMNWVRQNWMQHGPNSCYVQYHPDSNQLFLLADDLTWKGPYTPGVVDPDTHVEIKVPNSVCTLNASASSVDTSGINLNVHLALMFHTPFLGTQNAWVQAWGPTLSSSWQPVGTWDVTPFSPTAPTATLTKPGSSGSGGTFTFKITDVNGSHFIPEAIVTFGPSLNASSACVISVFHDPDTSKPNNAWLRNDPGTGILGPILPGASTTEDSQNCSMNGIGASATDSGNDWTYTFSVAFKSAFAGQQNVYLTVFDRANHESNNGVTFQFDTYTVNSGTVATPAFSPEPGTYPSSQSVTISSTAGATIRYTTDGTAPTKTSGTIYTGPLTVSSNQTVKAIAYETGWTDSAVASASYVINQSGGANGYSYGRAITISGAKVPSNQTDFPVLISGVYNYLGTAPPYGRVQNANGYDIIFTSDLTGSTPLSFEREKYVAATGEVAFWVRIPILSHPGDTTIYMWYGKSGISSDTATPAQVWDGNFAAVYHLNGAIMNDSTAANNGSPTNVTAALGQVAGAGSFDGSSSYADVGANIPALSSGATFSAWVKASDTGFYHAALTNNNSWMTG
jgi:hypothetical protein